MDALELEQRRKVVAEAKEWLHTPYHPMARIKGIGADCAQFPAAIYEAAGLIPHIPLEPYSHQWHLHQSDEVYLKMVLKFAWEIEVPPQPGDFVLFRQGKTLAHGAIVIDWPLVIHSVSAAGRGVVETDITREPFSRRMLIDVEHHFFTLWGKK